MLVFTDATVTINGITYEGCRVEKVVTEPKRGKEGSVEYLTVTVPIKPEKKKAE